MRSFRKVFAIAFLLCSSQVALAQLNLGGGGMGSRDTSSKKFKVTGFPYLNYDRTQEFMFGAVGMGMFRFNREDTISPKSMVGLMAIGTTTQTWGAMGFSQFYWNEDKWRATVFGGYFSFNFQFLWSPTPDFGSYIRYNTGYSMLYVRLLRKVSGNNKKLKLYLGGHAMLANAQTTFQLVDTNVTVEPNNLNNIGIDMDLDTRDNVYFPKKGFYVESMWDHFGGWLGNRNAFNKIELSVNNYQKWGKRFVQASRFRTAFAIGSVPFEGQEIIGRTDIRGYSQGAQRGDQLFAIQTETRIHIWKRLGAVVFAGLATTGSKASDYTWDNLWPGIGGGLRVTVMKEEMFRIGLDVAAGRDDWSMSFTIGESF